MSGQIETGVAPAAGLSRGVTLAMAVACGVAVANIYYNQPMLGILQRGFPDQTTLVGFVPTATQLGYASGIFLLVPLGDRLEPRKLILTQICGLMLALAAAALAPGAWVLIAASMCVGMTATVAQEIIPLAAELAVPARRGATIGTVMSGLLCGILFGRTLAGFVGQHFGWRFMFALSIAIVLAAALMLAWVLPRAAPRRKIAYSALIGSIFTLFREIPRLRLATAIQTAMFASFSTFWTILALHLEQPPYNMGADIAGLFGVLGAFGILMAPLVGRIADHRGSGAGIWLGIGLSLASWLLIGATQSIVGLAIGVIVLDVGQQCCMISNQHVVFTLRPEARSRINTVFVCGIFLGGSAGSAGAMLCWKHGGWPLVCLYGIAWLVVALTLHFLGQRRQAPSVA